MELLNYQRFLFLIFLFLKGFKSVFAGISCSFDHGWCDWKNELGSNFLWKQGNGQTDDRSSGPLNDHTCRNIMGKYIYVTGHDAKQKNDIAVVKSPTFSLDKPSNLTFWYNMNGVGIGQLSLFKRAGGQTTELWKREGRQGMDWMQGVVLLQPGKMSLEFSATTRLHYGSDVALDDIHLQTEPEDFSEKYCKLPTTASTSTSTSTTTTTQTTTHLTTKEPKYLSHCEKADGAAADILPGTCNFEKSLCGNKVFSYGRIWPITWHRTDETKDGIEGDHTHLDEKSSKGYYMQFDNGLPWGSRKYSASIETPPITTESICLTFWYNMPSTYSNLNVSVQHGNVSKEIWKREKTFSGTFQGWHKAVLSIKQKPPFSIVFLTYNKNHKAYVGIDDIVIVGTSKRVLPSVEFTSSVAYLTNKTTTNPVPRNTSTRLTLSTATSVRPGLKNTSMANSLSSSLKAITTVPRIANGSLTTSTSHAITLNNTKSLSYTSSPQVTNSPLIPTTSSGSSVTSESPSWKTSGSISGQTISVFTDHSSDALSTAAVSPVEPVVSHSNTLSPHPMNSVSEMPNTSTKPAHTIKPNNTKTLTYTSSTQVTDSSVIPTTSLGSGVTESSSWKPGLSTSGQSTSALPDHSTAILSTAMVSSVNSVVSHPITLSLNTKRPSSVSEVSETSTNPAQTRMPIYLPRTTSANKRTPSFYSSIPTSNPSLFTNYVASSHKTTWPTTIRTSTSLSIITVIANHSLLTNNLSTVSKPAATNSPKSPSTTMATVNTSSSTKAAITPDVLTSPSSGHMTVLRTTNALPMKNTTNSINATLSKKTTKPGYTTKKGSHNNLFTKYLTEDPKGTKKMTIASTTEQSTKKVKQSTKKPRKQNEDEFQRQTGSDDASDSGLSSLVIAAITVGCACVIFILVLTVYILLPKLRKSENRPNETAHHLNGHVHHDTNNFSLLNGKNEHMNGGLKFIKTSTFQTDFGTKSETIDNFDVERISISTKL